MYLFEYVNKNLIPINSKYKSAFYPMADQK